MRSEGGACDFLQTGACASVRRRRRAAPRGGVRTERAIGALPAPTPAALPAGAPASAHRPWPSREGVTCRRRLTRSAAPRSPPPASTLPRSGRRSCSRPRSGTRPCSCERGGEGGGVWRLGSCPRPAMGGPRQARAAAVGARAVAAGWRAHVARSRLCGAGLVAALNHPAGWGCVAGESAGRGVRVVDRAAAAPGAAAALPAAAGTRGARAARGPGNNAAPCACASPCVDATCGAGSLVQQLHAVLQLGGRHGHHHRRLGVRLARPRHGGNTPACRGLLSPPLMEDAAACSRSAGGRAAVVLRSSAATASRSVCGCCGEPLVCVSQPLIVRTRRGRTKPAVPLGRWRCDLGVWGSGQKTSPRLNPVTNNATSAKPHNELG